MPWPSESSDSGHWYANKGGPPDQNQGAPNGLFQSSLQKPIPVVRLISGLKQILRPSEYLASAVTLIDLKIKLDHRSSSRIHQQLEFFPIEFKRWRISSITTWRLVYLISLLSGAENWFPDNFEFKSGWPITSADLQNRKLQVTCSVDSILDQVFTQVYSTRCWSFIIVTSPDSYWILSISIIS